MPQPSKGKASSKKKDEYFDEEEHMYFENLRKKIKSYEVEENEKIKKRKTKPTPAPDANTPAEPVKEEPAKDEGVSFNAATSLLVLEAMEELVRNVRESSTKRDLDEVISTVDQIATKQEASQLILENVKHDLEADVKGLTTDIVAETSALKGEISRLDTILNSIRGQVGDINERHEKQGQGLHTLSGDVTNAISSESSSSHRLLWGIMIVQMVLAAGFVIFKQYSDGKAKTKTNFY